MPTHSVHRTPPFSTSRLTRLVGLCCLFVLCLGASGLAPPHVTGGVASTEHQWVGHGEQRNYAYLPELPRIRHQLHALASDDATLLAALGQGDDPLAIQALPLAAVCLPLSNTASAGLSPACQAQRYSLPPGRAPPVLQAA
ncbi:hypothetical protein RVM27_04130 [Halomonas sp. KM007]